MPRKPKYKYLEADKGFWINDNDPDLEKVWIPLPKPPPLKDIGGYGLAPKDQFFRRAEMPEKLEELDSRTKKLPGQSHRGNPTVSDKWQYLIEHIHDYQEEYDWIEEQWNRSINGHWVFIKGKPYFITGDHYWIYNFWRTEGYYLDYRDRDRRHWHAVDFCFKDPKCLGIVWPKHRREGWTTRALGKMYKESMLNAYSTHGIQSMTESNVKHSIMPKMKAGWKNVPFWFKPAYSGVPNPSMAIEWSAWKDKDKAPNDMKELQSKIVGGPSGEFHFDGYRFATYFGDEEGKCFGPGTEILMLDGSKKLVEHIEDGDKIMGPRGQERTARGIKSGQEEMYLVKPNKWQDWECNKSHILSLKVSSSHPFSKIGWNKDEVVNITIKEYLSLNKNQKKHLMLYKSMSDYPEKNLPIPPYILGLWLGDGISRSTSLTSIDKETISEWKYYGESLGMSVRSDGDKTYHITCGQPGGHNPFLKELKNLDLIKNKHIPDIYMRGSEEQRLELLAGLLDTDGSASQSKFVYEFIQKNNVLSNQVHELTQQLGFNSSLVKKRATMKRDNGTIYSCLVGRQRIYGDLWRVPCRIDRKKYTEPESHHKNRRDPMRSGFSVEPLGVGHYYGFTLEEDPLFLLGDCQVVHNTIEANIDTRHNVIKECCMLGDQVVGFIMKGSTVEEMDARGGANFKKLCDQSLYHSKDPDYKRNSAGMTPSGMYMFFIPADDGLPGFIDKYGFSNRVGAREYLESQRKALLALEDMEGFASYRRKYPMSYRECWMASGKGQNFDPKLLSDRIDDLRLGGLSEAVRGDLEWVDGVKDTKVEFVPNPEGRFYISKLFPTSQMNRYEVLPRKGGGSFRAPLMTERAVAGGDSYKFNEKQSTLGKNHSLGGGAVFWKRDRGIDPDEKPVLKWESHRFVCDYLYRPQIRDEFGEDMLKMCVFYSCLMDHENNINFLEEYFIARGYEGYLYYNDDPMTGAKATKSGTYTDENEREGIFSAYQKYIKKHIKRDHHLRILQQCQQIEDKMGDFDVFVAGGRALRAALKDYEADYIYSQRWSTTTTKPNDNIDLFPYEAI